MKLRHFSNKPLEHAQLRVVKQHPYDPRNYYGKPIGLWVSDESQFETGWSWAAWCASETFDRGTIEHEIGLAPDANILRVTTVQELDAFAHAYGAFEIDRPYLHDEPTINWPRVATDYDGILITPYQSTRRLHHGSSWYYGWDCASGCIWQPRAIAAINIIEPLQEAAQ